MCVNAFLACGVALQTITDDQAKVLIDMGMKIRVFVHTGSKRELLLKSQLDRLASTIGSYKAFEMHCDDIKNPAKNLLGFVRYPRLLLYKGQHNEKDLLGFEAIETWIKQQT